MTAVEADPTAALDELRRLVRRRRRGGVPTGDLLYRVYVTVLLSLFGFYLALGVIDDAAIGPTEIDWVRDHAVAWVGLVPALAIAAGIRSGSSGGPLLVDRVELHHVVMSPLDRRTVLAPAARRLVLTGAALGVVFGAAAGELASRRLPGAAASWVPAGALAGLTTALLGIGAALVATSSALVRRRPWIAAVAAPAVIGWSVADIAFDQATSPGSVAARIALWPIDRTLWAAAATVAAVALTAVGWRRLGGVAVERTARRADLVRLVRFALAQQDIRSLILLRRQLGFERPRARPWFRFHSPALERRAPAVVRCVRSYLRWPLTRVIRVGALAAVGGLALGGVWRGTTALAVVTALALYLCTLEVVEPFAQELDHPMLLELVPSATTGTVLFQQVLTAAAFMAVVWIIVAGVAAAVAQSSTLLAVAVAAAAPCAVAAAGGGALSIRRIDTPDDSLLVPAEMAGPQAVYRLVWPVVLAGAGVVPVIVARDAVADGRTAASGSTGVVIAISLVAAVVVGWIKVRDDVRAQTAAAAAARSDR